jgi:DNA-binding NtrC family response regulator
MPNTAPLRPDPPRTESGTRARTGRVLVISDDDRSSTAIADVLSDHLEVMVLEDPAKAVAHIAAGARFDVVLSDLVMRGMNGAELFARVCAASTRQAARIVFLGGGTMPLAVAELLSRVPNQCLKRPLDLEALRALVDHRVNEEIARSSPSSQPAPKIG